jgi:hypothetical protein
MPHEPMRNDTNRLICTLLWGVFSLALGASCLLVAAGSDAETISLQQLAGGGSSLLMSCADDETPNGEPMWCANPDSPRCLPAVPKPSAPDVTQGPVATLLAALVPTQARAHGVLTAWPTARTQHMRSLQLQHRLERPPRV